MKLDAMCWNRGHTGLTTLAGFPACMNRSKVTIPGLQAALHVPPTRWPPVPLRSAAGGRTAQVHAKPSNSPPRPCPSKWLLAWPCL